MIEQLIAEATECDFKVALETKKPKSWLKSVSAFSYGIGGTLFFGVSDDREPIGLSDVQKDAEAVSRLIKERITLTPVCSVKGELVRLVKADDALDDDTKAAIIAIGIKALTGEEYI